MKKHKHAPYKLAVVTWEDAFSISGDMEEDDERLAEPYLRYSCGWLIKRRPVVLAETFDRKGISHTTTIPRSYVRNMTVHEVIDDDGHLD